MHHAPLVHYVGPALPVSPPAISPELLEFLESGGPNKKTILISFGTVAYGTPESVGGILEATRHFPDHKIIWVLRNRLRKLLPADEPLPPNVRLESWIPQASVLAHPSIDLMFTVGGINSVSEALAIAGVPLLCMG